MKKKIGEIYNKPIVTGDKNLVTKNEIHESTLKGGGTVDSGSSDVEYWKIHVQWPYGDIIGALYKNVTSDGVIIQKYPDEDGTRIKAIVFIPTYIEHDNYATLYVSFKDVVKAMIGGVVPPEFETQFNSLFTPITKEEFYDLNNI